MYAANVGEFQGCLYRALCAFIFAIGQLSYVVCVFFLVFMSVCSQSVLTNLHLLLFYTRVRMIVPSYYRIGR